MFYTNQFIKDFEKILDGPSYLSIDEKILFFEIWVILDFIKSSITHSL